MTPEQLKASILQYAIQGKLVEQRPEEGNAEELYQQIQAEKQKLIKEGKIKKEKPLGEITQEEIPFDIPENWKWVHLNTIATSNLGKTLNKSTDEGEIVHYLCSINVYWEGINLETVKQAKFDETAKEKYKLQKGDLLICEGGDAGRCAIWKSEQEMYYQNALHRVRFYGKINPQYICYVLECYKKTGIINNYTKGIGIKHLVQTSLNALWLPLPPLAEQHRIVTKIEELLPFVDRYAASYEKLEHFHAKFPEDMKKSILQYAIQGKLVEQRPEEGNAEELYQQIQAEKQKLLKKGQIKKEKPLAEITDDEIPFDIPETWKWVQLQDIVKKTIKRGKSPKYVEQSDVQVFAQKCNVKTGGINMGLAQYLNPAEFDKYPNEEYMINGDIVINSTGGGTMGRVGVFHDTDRINNMIIVPDSHVTIIRASDLIDYKYLYYFIKYNQKYLETQGEGSTNQTELKPVTIASLILPLPPLAEQHRIVAKIEELLPYCNRLAE